MTTLQKIIHFEMNFEYKFVVKIIYYEICNENIIVANKLMQSFAMKIKIPHKFYDTKYFMINIYDENQNSSKIFMTRKKICLKYL